MKYLPGVFTEVPCFEAAEAKIAPPPLVKQKDRPSGQSFSLSALLFVAD